ncbi:MAG: DNA cytosine methyltransferase [Gammaproteobacteria bacterium]|nr:DNA cytosine methyltransferase [Gammaproteobacteria bacterium]
MLTEKPSPYPIVDVFAGPGGLGEGFSVLRDDQEKTRFRSVVAIERDGFAHKTLLLRHFVRNFPKGGIPDDYYSYLGGDLELGELYARHKAEFADARKSALKISLGPENHAKVKQIIDQRLEGKARWALLGGPPCQAYSLAGRSRMSRHPDFEKDERHSLYREYLKIIADHQPPVFVFENVKGLLSARLEGDLTINRIVSDLKQPKAALENRTDDLSYRLYSLSETDSPDRDFDPRLFMVEAEKYGVPQARHRMFIVGVRSDIKKKPWQLHPQGLRRTVKETIGDLPQIRSGLSRGQDSFQSWRQAISGLNDIDFGSQLNGASHAKEVECRIRQQIKNSNQPEARFSRVYPGCAEYPTSDEWSDPCLTVLTGHDSRTHMASDLQRYMYASVFAAVTGKSPTLVDFPSTLLPNHVNVGLERNGDIFSDRFRVQLPDQVSKTITSHISKDGHYYIHYDPSQCRSLTVREAARLQTFPDNYKFEGPRTSQYHQVGNAVPPYLAMQIAEIIADILDSMGGGD